MPSPRARSISILPDGRPIAYAIENAATPEEKLRNHQYLLQIKLETATEEAYEAILTEFQTLFDTYGRDRQTYSLQIDYNHFLKQNN